MSKGKSILSFKRSLTEHLIKPGIVLDTGEIRPRRDPCKQPRRGKLKVMDRFSVKWKVRIEDSGRNEIFKDLFRFEEDNICTDNIFLKPGIKEAKGDAI